MSLQGKCVFPVFSSTIASTYPDLQQGSNYKRWQLQCWANWRRRRTGCSCLNCFVDSLTRYSQESCLLQGWVGANWLVVSAKFVLIVTTFCHGCHSLAHCSSNADWSSLNWETRRTELLDELIIKGVNFVPNGLKIQYSNKILYLTQQHNGFADENKRAEHGGKAPVPAKGLYLLQ